MRASAVGALILGAVLPAIALPAAAQQTAQETAQETASSLDASVSLRADAWSGSRLLDGAGPLGRTSAWTRAKLGLGDAGSVSADGWIAAQAGGSETGASARLRELYWRGDVGPLDLRIGRQAIVWGRADGLNPTDNLAPRDFTLLTPEDGEQRRGNEAVAASVDAGFGVVSAAWFPRAASHVLPLPQQAGIVYDIAGAPKRSQWALKLDMVGDGIDGSISYFHGDDPLPDLNLAGAGAAGGRIAVRNNPLRVLGADLSLTQGGIVWRAEAAWMQTANAGSGDFERKKPRLWAVAGPEWTSGGGTTVGLQITAQHVRGFESADALPTPLQREVARRQAALANQTAATQLGATWRVAHRWLNDNLRAEFSGVIASAPRSGLWRTRVVYAVSDSVQLQAGTDQAFGPVHSVFGQFRRNRLAFVQVRYGF